MVGKEVQTPGAKAHLVCGPKRPEAEASGYLEAGIQEVEQLVSEMAAGKDIWPELEWGQWSATAETLHMWMQIVGKTRMALTPLKNHWWNVPLYVTARGLTTSAIPWRGGALEIEFDLLVHMVVLRTSEGEVRRVELERSRWRCFMRTTGRAAGAGCGGDDMADAGGGGRAGAV